jgi:hypothetical protein
MPTSNAAAQILNEEFTPSVSGPPSAVSPQGAVAAPRSGYCGLEVTKAPPHTIVGVDEALDVNGVQQGAPGYANQAITPGDRIISVDGRPAEYVSVHELHGMLGGAINSIVKLALAHPITGAQYTVFLRRHAMHDHAGFSAATGLPEFIVHSEKEPERAYIGLQITDRLPHAITGVDDLMDEHLVRQGEPDYANPTVHVGDLVLQVDGKPSTHVTVEEMHEMLRGQINTPVEVTLARAHHPSEKYTIRVMRHRFHQVDSFDENSGRQSPYMQPGESEGFWWNREGPIKEIAGPTHWVGEARAGGTHALTDRAPLAGSAKDLYHHYGQHRHQRHPEGLVEVDEDGQASVSILVYFCICWYRCEPCRIYSKPARLWKV